MESNIFKIFNNFDSCSNQNSETDIYCILYVDEYEEIGDFTLSTRDER